MNDNIENQTPEQKAKFYSQNTPIFDSKPKFKVKPIIIGFISALFIFGLVYRFVIYKPNYQILTPIPRNPMEQDDSYKFVNPLTGEKVLEAEAAPYKDLRPIGIMINNYLDARPQSGLFKADFVYEIVAEGGITRFLAFFLSDLPEKIGPVRSTREYYLVLVKELGDAMIMHIGWSPQALEAIDTWPVRSLGRGGAQFWRDQGRIDEGIAIEHTAYVKGPELRELGDTLGWGGKRDFVSLKFKDNENVDKSQPCLVGECDKLISIDFWYKGDYTGIFKYDRNTNSYLRFSGYDLNNQPIALLDLETQEQVKAKNLIIQFVPEVPITGDDKSRLDYQLIGSGKALVFIDGKVIQATWSKPDRDARTLFYDSAGQEILFNRGKFWVSIVPDRNIEQVVY